MPFPARESNSPSRVLDQYHEKRRAPQVARKPTPEHSPATSPAAASETPSIRPTRSRSTNGGFSAPWHCCCLPLLPSCCANRRLRKYLRRPLQQASSRLLTRMPAQPCISLLEQQPARMHPCSMHLRKSSSPWKARKSPAPSHPRNTSRKRP